MMSCYENFKNDRTCELCRIANSNEYNQCKSVFDESVRINKKLNEIERNCPYRKDAYGDYEKYDGCYKDGEFPNNQKQCKACLECEQYIK
jgi:hypothetical protein